MKIDDPLEAAFEVIRRELGLDMLTNVPHPENLRFQMHIERRTLRRLGVMLAGIVLTEHDQDVHYVAHVIRRYFGDALGMEPVPEFIGDVPRFLLAADAPVTTRTDPQQLALHLQGLALPQDNVICRVFHNLSLLQKLLNLTDSEVSYLAVAYTVSRQYQHTTSVSYNLTLALQHVALGDESHRDKAIAALLDVPLADVSTLFAPLCRLKALRFVDTLHTGEAPNLCSCFVLTDAFVALLESQHRSHNALLQAILEPEDDLNLLHDDTIPIGHLYAEFPKEVAEAYECAVLQRPLKALHIYALVRWYTGASPALPSHYSPLAGRVDLVAVREAIKRAAFDGCRASTALDVFALMKALYANAMK